ncbi:MAG: dolichyl-phosphate mannose synthase [Lachnospiraceae bacterium]|nr:dolichyl-phosphate mannose synthase [Lachnospiraceae bacterium]
MDKIHLIMPMGGGGTRFGNHGFNLPKPLIPLQGKPFFYWATKCVSDNIDVCDITFAVLKEHIERFAIDEEINKYFPEAKICVIDHVLKGAVLTCLEGIKGINDDLPLLFNDCDHAFKSLEFDEFAKKADFASPDGALLTFKSDNPAYSYAKFENGKVVGTIEKVVVSDEAICGAYYFKNRKTFEKASDIYLEKCSYKEFFVSGVYNELIGLGGCVETFNVDTHVSFGTPDEYEIAVSDNRLEGLVK